MDIAIEPSAFSRRNLLQDYHIMKTFQGCILPIIHSIEHIVTLNRYAEFIHSNGTFKLAQVSEGTFGRLTALLSEWVYREPYKGMYYVGNTMEDPAGFAEKVLGRFYEKMELDRLTSQKERHFLHQSSQGQIVLTTYSSYYRTERIKTGEHMYTTMSNRWEYFGTDTKEYGDYSEENVIAVMKKFIQEGRKNVYVLLHTGKESSYSSFSLKWNIEVLYGKIEECHW